MSQLTRTSKSHLTILFVTVFIDLVGFGIIIPLTPYLATEFGATSQDVGVLMSVYSLCQFLFSPFWGRLSDRFGRRPILLMSLLGSALSYLGFAFAGSLTMLILCRVFAGAFTANISTAMASIADVTPTEKRAQSMGLIGAAFGIGFIVGPAFGGLLSEWGAQIGTAPPWGMSFPSLGAAALCFINFVSAIFFLPESLPQEKRTRTLSSPNVVSLPDRLKKVFEAFGKPLVGPLMWIYFFTGLAMAPRALPQRELWLVFDEIQLHVCVGGFGDGLHTGLFDSKASTEVGRTTSPHHGTLFWGRRPRWPGLYSGSLSFVSSDVFTEHRCELGESVGSWKHQRALSDRDSRTHIRRNPKSCGLGPNPWTDFGGISLPPNWKAIAILSRWRTLRHRAYDFSHDLRSYSAFRETELTL
jgi:multidrug resistance protein